jgi:hypothetical protein
MLPLDKRALRTLQPAAGNRSLLHLLTRHQVRQMALTVLQTVRSVTIQILGVEGEGAGAGVGGAVVGGEAVLMPLECFLKKVL